ncbi:hypothetical protein BKA82DRAFT_995673 [Pisolithus tinctorius]|uniref:Uncharacterized protein n=1 Tax=Pisolithus tinctorius Marx 270 TaxID=870435 RepID=A0A0C3KLJ7_PISTI|nr:hypothetical protein BKA82DRAFT_995673 [Pisolithus tinctorius]KIO10482.1 hypothetical protein M404DRAFT_995673 [Pisolithus tinctorius Marx 270]
MAVPTYLPHILYSTALTSVSIHLLWRRKAFEDDRARHNAQITILEDLARQLRSGSPDITDEEVDRLRNLVRVHQGTSEAVAGVQENKMSWKDVFWGKKALADDHSKADEWERKDLEQLRAEFNRRT